VRVSPNHYVEANDQALTRFLITLVNAENQAIYIGKIEATLTQEKIFLEGQRLDFNLPMDISFLTDF